MTMHRCKEKTEVYSRIVGYYRPVQTWNPGKREEYKGRKVFNVAKFVTAKSDNTR